MQKNCFSALGSFGLIKDTFISNWNQVNSAFGQIIVIKLDQETLNFKICWYGIVECPKWFANWTFFIILYLLQTNF